MASAHLRGNALDTIGQEIVAGVRPADSVLTLADLAQRFGVSRTVAREIMLILDSLGLVRGRRRVGIVVRPRSAWALLDPMVLGWRLRGSDRDRALLEIAELRAAIQPTAAELAAEHATQTQRAQLVALADEVLRTSRSGPLAAQADAELAFQQLLLQASGNELFAGFARVLAVGERQDRSRPPEPGLVWAERYRRIAAAIASGDGSIARVASRAQVAQGLAGLAAQLRSPQPARPASSDHWSV